MQQPPVPEPRDLLPPLLACLPTTFIATRPPPALLPLLAPILRQRLNFLNDNQRSNSDGWAKLLCWDSQQAEKLPGVIERLDLEPHPISGEVEIEEVQSIQYRRLDEETLQARLQAEQFDLLPIYVWCQEDEHGETGPGWKLTELRALDDLVDGSVWHTSISRANQAYTAQGSAVRKPSVATSLGDGDDSYWAAYDSVPAETPVHGRSPAPQTSLTRAMERTGHEEEDYYARYGNEVQPALDSHDPDEEMEDTGESTLTGTQQRLKRPISVEITAASPPVQDDRPAWQKALYPHSKAHDSAVASSLAQSVHSELNMPRPISPASSIRSIEKLEEQAATMSDESAGSTSAEVGVRQHISTEIKSLHRLARSTGMSRADFEELVKRQLDVLSLLDDE